MKSHEDRGNKFEFSNGRNSGRNQINGEEDDKILMEFILGKKDLVDGEIISNIFRWQKICGFFS